jgi:glyoxylase-like metal-dependent hydrolase (beta-lactamase superfamily II)
MKGLVRRFAGWSALALLLTIGGGTLRVGLVTAQAPQPRASGVKLYVMDGGWLKDQPPASYELTREQVPDSDMSVPVFLVVHPRGTLIFDTGLGDRFAGGRETPANKSWQVQRTVRSQLAEIGHTPESITYLAISHSHGDHTGNANDYANATWLVQRPERDLMFGEKPPRTYDAYKALKDSRTKVLDGDYDVFQDGSVVIKSTPGHTPGHQSLFVKLTRRAPVVLSGDLYHFPLERTLDKVPTFEFNKEQTRASRAALEAFMKKAGAELWIQHDTATWATLLKSPKFYE